MKIIKLRKGSKAFNNLFNLMTILKLIKGGGITMLK